MNNKLTKVLHLIIHQLDLHNRYFFLICYCVVSKIKYISAHYICSKCCNIICYKCLRRNNQIIVECYCATCESKYNFVFFASTNDQQLYFRKFRNKIQNTQKDGYENKYVQFFYALF